MITVNILHEPVNVKEMVSSIKPEIENKHVDQDLFDHLEEGEFVLSPCPVTVEGGVWFNLPNP